jgi:hypothetical protein
MMQQFRKECDIPQYRDLDNTEYWNKMLDNILAGQGVVYLEDGIGLIIGIVLPTIWCDKTFALHELAWWVHPNKRNTTVGYKLLKAYVQYGKTQKSNGRIKMFTVSKMVTSPDLNYERFGFTKLDENWIQ